MPPIESPHQTARSIDPGTVVVTVPASYQGDMVALLTEPPASALHTGDRLFLFSAIEGVETPYALNVDRRTDTVWICGTNSDSLIRFEPERERFTVYPLPTRVTYTREIDFDEQGRIWTSNSNMPTWQIEGAHPRVLRLDPSGAAPVAPVVARTAALER